MRTLPPAARRYVLLVVGAGVVVVAAAGVRLAAGAVPLASVATLALMHVITESLWLRPRNDRAAIALGSVIALAAVPLTGAAGAAVVAVCGGLLRIEHAPWYKKLFNSAQYSICAGAAGVAYVLAGGTTQLSAQLDGVDVFRFVVLPMLVADCVQCLLNGLLVSRIVSITQEVPARIVLAGLLRGSSLAYMGYGLFGLLLAVLWGGVGIGPFAAVLVLIPLFVARWAYAQYAEQQLAYDRTIRTLVQAVETKDLYTRGHSERVSKASVMIARRLGMREDRVNSLRYAGILHDVGKLGVPTRLLQKTGRLTEEEFSAIKMHPVRGLEMVREISFLDEAYAGIMHHHERLDGRGYPSGLAGGQIPEFARVIAVADAFDSMTTTRSYRGARSVDEAVEELQRCAGTQFDPTMVDALVTAIGDQGWQAETEPLFEPPAEPSAYRGYDHDDPTVEIAPAAETGRA